MTTRRHGERRYVKHLLDRYAGYWVYKSRHLPVGADLRLDLKRLGISVNTVFDVGANVGQSYLRFRNDFPQAAIYCFEPVKSTYESLCLAVRHDARARAEHLALGSTPGQQTIEASVEWNVLNSVRDDVKNSASDVRAETVTIETLDNYCAVNAITAIDLLKIDSEGYEMEVLEGARQNLGAGSIGAVLCEVGFSSRNRRNTPARRHRASHRRGGFLLRTLRRHALREPGDGRKFRQCFIRAPGVISLYAAS
ncbi:MAG: FkbM family methyltransferase [Gemmatimonadaceae bacterium]|nr:FkbM family methyltransferase [Gemmatimonadaceae bacterium]